MESTMLKSFSRATALALLFGSVVGCDEVTERIDDVVGGDESDREDAARAAASMDLTRLESALLSAAIDNIDDFEAAPSDVAAAIAASASATFTPADCVEATAVGGTVTFQFDACSGPRGISGLSGLATLLLTEEPGASMGLVLNANNLEIAGATMSIAVNGPVSPAGDDLTITASTAGGGTTPDGVVVARLGGYVTELRDDCMTINGQWSSSVGEVFYATQVAEFVACGNACPSRGSLTFLGVDSAEAAQSTDPLPDGEATVLTYDGEDTVRYVSASIATGRIPLNCGN